MDTAKKNILNSWTMTKGAARTLLNLYEADNEGAKYKLPRKGYTLSFVKAGSKYIVSVENKGESFLVEHFEWIGV